MSCDHKNIRIIMFPVFSHSKKLTQPICVPKCCVPKLQFDGSHGGKWWKITTRFWGSEGFRVFFSSQPHSIYIYKYIHQVQSHSRNVTSNTSQHIWILPKITWIFAAENGETTMKPRAGFKFGCFKEFTTLP